MIRRITIDDVDVFRDIRLRALQDAPEAFASTYADSVAKPREEWVERVGRCADGGEFALFLAFDDDGRCIGLVGGADDEYGADHQLISMWVEPQSRGTGVAVDLVNAVVEWCRAAGSRTLSLWVTRGNDRAQRFYERLGFVVTGEVQPLPSDPCKDEVRMVRDLVAEVATGKCS